MSTDLRVASFNASLNRSAEGELIADLSTPDNVQAQAVAEIIQRANPDVVLVNEFDFDADGAAADLFRDNYLEVSQNGVDPVEYPFVYVAPSNTGILTGFDKNNDGIIATEADLGSFTYANDSFGFGQFPGQFGYVIYSKYEIDTDNIRTFQEFLWADMPDAQLFDITEGERPLFDPARPFDPANPDDPNTSFFTEDEAMQMRLSAKNHVDVPVIVDGETVHVLAAHPTPPVFDGAEDLNGKLNFDEIRFWTDYVAGSDYIYDDAGVTGGLAPGARFVIVGDYNADPFDGDSRNGAANQFFESPYIFGSTTDESATPGSVGGREQAALQGALNDTHIGDPAFDTADFGPDTTVGNLRVDYALPSTAGLTYQGGGVFWPGTTDPLFELTGTFPFPTSDHRMVFVDLEVTDQGTPNDPDRTDVTATSFGGLVEIPSGTEFDETVIGGLSGLVRNPITGTYLAVSDDRGTEAEDGTILSSPRVYELAIDLSDGSLDEGDVTVLDVITLTQITTEGVLPLNTLNPDLEGIAIGSNGNLLISSERDFEGTPAIYEFSPNGQLLAEAPVDAKFIPDALGDEQTRGVLNNLGFEALSISPDGTTLYVGTEGGLIQDGGRATFDTSAFSRIIEYDLTTGQAVAEYVYPVDPIAVPTEGFADSGLVEVLALDNEGTLIALERSFSLPEEATLEDRGYTGKVYLTTTQGATDVSGVAALPLEEDDGEIEPLVDELLQKRLLVDLEADFGIEPDNIEGLALGPVNADGTVPLIVMSDDNFSAFGPQANQFLVVNLELEDIPAVTAELETPSILRYPGPEPLVIAHRGFSADRPEHTLEAYQLAIDAGADFIEPDLVLTADGELIARHEPWLATVELDENGEIVFDANGDPIVTFETTNVADLPQFADKLTIKTFIPEFPGFGGQTIAGWFAEDFTLDEIKELRAREDQPDLRPQSAAFDDQFEIPTLEEIIEIAEAAGVGIYPETKEPLFFEHIGSYQNEDANGNGTLDDGEDINQNGTLDQVNGGTLINVNTSQLLVDTLVETGFTDPEDIFIQSFGLENLLDLNENILPAAGLDLPLVQLSFGATAFPPIDILYHFGILGIEGGDPTVYDSLGGFITAETTFADLLAPEGLAQVATYAEGLGPSLATVISQPGLANDDFSFVESGLVDDAQAAGLMVHAYTHRDETNFQIDLDGTLTTPEETYEIFLETGIDGLFTDNPDTGVAVQAEIYGDGGNDPDDPAVWINPDDAGASLVIVTAKEGGLRVYDLAGEELFSLEPDAIRYNNVDIVYDLVVAGTARDVAVVSDRANDSIAFFEIDPSGELREITASNAPASLFGVDDGEATAYGLTTYTSLEDGTEYAFVTQADGNQIVQVEIQPNAAGTVGYEVVRTIELPVGDGDPEDFQSEGIAVDRELGLVYVSVEDEIGLVSFEAEPDAGDDLTVIAPIDAPFFTPDLEGVSIHYGENGTGSILVSSQGNATFVAFDRLTGEYQGRFAITGDGVDGVQESDGLEIVSAGLGDAFPNGLLVTQDGNNEPQNVFGDPEDGEIQNFDVNFKYTDLGTVIETVGLVPGNPDFDPRNIEAGTRLEDEASIELGTETTVRAQTVTVTDAALADATLGTTEGGVTLAPAEGGEAATLLDADSIVFTDGAAEARDEAAYALTAIGYDIGFDRVYDMGGAAFWGALVEDGSFSLERFGEAVALSDEFAAVNGADLDAEAFLDAVIGNFDGTVSGAERTQFLAELEAGTATRGQVIADLASSEQAAEAYAGLVDDGVFAFA